MKLNYHIYTFLIILLYCQSVSAQTVVNSLEDFKAAMLLSDQNIVLTAGDYNLTDLESGARVINCSGSNNTIDMTGARIKTLVGSIREVYFIISGDNNTVKNGAIEDFYASGLDEITDFSAFNNDRDNLAYGLRGDPVMSITGNGNLVEGLEMIVKGSFPYGYGSQYGIGAVNTFGLNKRCGILITGSAGGGVGNTLDGITMYHYAFGHGIFMQTNATESVIKNCYIEGRMRLSDDMYNDTETYDLPYLTDYKFPTGSGSWRLPFPESFDIPYGVMYPLSEDGIRSYNGTGSVTVDNCTVKQMRGGIRLYLASSATITNSKAIDCGATNWNLPSGATVTNGSGNFAYAPLSDFRLSRSNTNVEWTIIPSPHAVGPHNLCDVLGNGHDIVFHRTPGLIAKEIRSIVILGSNSTIVNETEYPIVLESTASGNTIVSGAPVIDNGSGNSIEKSQLGQAIPGTIEFEDFETYTGSGEGVIYHDADETNTGGDYRIDEGVDIETCTEGGYQLVSLEDGEWLKYNVEVPETALYNISIRYASANADGKIKFSFDGVDKTDEVVVPFGGANSTGINDWQDLTIASDILLIKGLQSMTVSISGASNSFVLNSFDVGSGSPSDCDNGLTSVETSFREEPGVFYQYFEGAWDALPDFNTLTSLKEGFSDVIGLVEGVGSDNFGLVFEGYFETSLIGDYSFYTTSNEGSRLLIDGVEVVNNDGLHDAVEQSGSICLEAGTHTIRVEYFDKTGEEELTVMYAGPGVSKQVIPNLSGVATCPNTAIDQPDVLDEGLTYNYYEGTWVSLPDFETLTPVSRGNTDVLDLSMVELTEYFALKFEGYIQIATSGDYVFYTNSTDGSRLLIDDMEIVSNDGVHDAIEASGNVCLEAGYHSIQIEYFANVGTSALSAMYEGPELEKQSITQLYSDPIPAMIEQIITFSELPSKVIGDEDFDVTTSVDTGLPLVLTSSNPNVATIVNNSVIHIVSNGVTTITASQAGDWLHSSAHVSQELVVYTTEGCVLPWTMPNLTLKNEEYKYISEPIDISCVSGATISMSIFGTSTLAATDYVKVYYSIDGGEQQTITEFNGSSNEDIMIENISGSTISLTLEVLSSVTNGIYLLNDISVSEYVSAPVLSTEVEYSGVDIYPNPAQETMTVTLGQAGFLGYKIFTIDGRMIHQNSIPKGEMRVLLDISQFQNGVYLIKLYGGQSSPTLKILKQ